MSVARREKDIMAGKLEQVSVRPLRSLCLRGESLSAIAHHRDTENTKVSQRGQRFPGASDL
jgi:hypothetical protein